MSFETLDFKIFDLFSYAPDYMQVLSSKDRSKFIEWRKSIAPTQIAGIVISWLLFVGLSVLFWSESGILLAILILCMALCMLLNAWNALMTYLFFLACQDRADALNGRLWSDFINQLLKKESK